MKAAVRFYSRGGNVKALAEAFARGAGVEALSVDAPGALLTEPVEVLFIGGALYKYRLDKALVDYIKAIPEGLVGRAVCFGSSYLTRRPVYLIQELLKGRGIAIVPQAVYARNRPKQSLIDACEYFAAREIDRDTSLDGLSPYERFRAMRIATGDVALEDAEADVEERSAFEGAADHDGVGEEGPSGEASPLADPQDEDREVEGVRTKAQVSDEAHSNFSSDGVRGTMFVMVDGVEEGWSDKLVETVEAIPNVELRLAKLPDASPSSLVFASEKNLAVDDVVTLVRSTLKVSDVWGAMSLRVEPYGKPL